MALALKRERPDWEVVAIDLSPAALDQARANSAELGLDVEIRKVDALDPQALAALGPFHGAVSNPPYIPQSEGLVSHVVDHEPSMALFVPDDDPLCFYQALVDWASGSLTPGGCLVAECHHALVGRWRIVGNSTAHSPSASPTFRVPNGRSASFGLDVDDRDHERS